MPENYQPPARLSSQNLSSRLRHALGQLKLRLTLNVIQSAIGAFHSDSLGEPTYDRREIPVDQA